MWVQRLHSDTGTDTRKIIKIIDLYMLQQLYHQVAPTLTSCSDFMTKLPQHFCPELIVHEKCNMTWFNDLNDLC